MSEFTSPSFWGNRPRLANKPVALSTVPIYSLCTLFSMLSAQLVSPANWTVVAELGKQSYRSLSVSTEIRVSQYHIVGFAGI